MAIALVLLIAELVWFILHRPVAVNDSGAQRVLAVARAAASAQQALDVAEPASAASAAGSVHGADEFEVCGGRWFKFNPEPTSAEREAFQRGIGLPEARASLMSALRADPSDYAHAVALQLAFADDTSQTATRDALIQLATTTRDPRVYALAFATCGNGSPLAADSACKMLNAAQWARLDPGNAAPWMAALVDAVARHDLAAQNEALYQIAHSERSEQRFLAVTGEVLAHMRSDDEADLPATLALAVDAAGVDAARQFPNYQNLTQTCRGAELTDANRRQTCAQIAELMFERSDTLLERLIGGAIGGRVGWPQERIEAARGQYSAYTQSILAKSASAAAGSCAAMRQDLHVFEERARLGEVGAVRQWIASSGKKDEDFVRLERDEQLRRVADAASAASAAALLPLPLGEGRGEGR